MFTSQGQAKRFLAEKIVAQAAHEGRPLSENEQWMLGFSESDPEFVVDLARIAAFEREIPDDQYEEKIAGLIERACEVEIDANPQARAQYKEALRVLNEGDHYLAIMAERGLGRCLRPWWAFWR